MVEKNKTFLIHLTCSIHNGKVKSINQSKIETINLQWSILSLYLTIFDQNSLITKQLIELYLIDEKCDETIKTLYSENLFINKKPIFLNKRDHKITPTLCEF